MAKKEGSKKDSTRVTTHELAEHITKLEVNIESLQAKQAAHEELRSLSDKKFDHITEEIGELKELFKILEEDKREIEVQVQQALRKVEATHPETLKKQYDSQVQAVEKIDSKFSLLNKQYEKFSDRFNSFEHKLKVFTGEEELLKLQQRIKQDLLDTEKVAHTAHKHASKIENHYIKINERVNTVERSLNEIKDLRKELETQQEELAGILNTAHEGPEGKISEIESTVDQLSKVMIDTFEKLKGKHQEHEAAISALKLPITADEVHHMKEWILYLIDKHEQ
jgi:predicted  nucleic acid-binding Zn-ribbon protein